MREFNRGVREGLVRAADIVFVKATKMRLEGNVTADTMARIFEDLAKEILEFECIIIGRV